MNIKLLVHRICKIFHIHIYYENKYGVKSFNKHASTKPINKKEVIVNPDEVLLGFDGLNNKSTLVGTPIPKSPHADLMRLLLKNKTILNSNYVTREENGSLDGRYGIRNNDHKKQFEKSYKQIMSDNYDPVLIYNIAGKYFAYDGKHRLALCSILGKKCRCEEINLSFFKKDKYTNNIYKRMCGKDKYSKNIKLLNEILNSNN